MTRRAENFATLAANATQRVVRIIHGNMVFGMREITALFPQRML